MSRRRIPRHRQHAPTVGKPRYKAALVVTVPFLVIAVFIVGLGLMRRAAAPEPDDRGLRIHPAELADASRVLDPARFQNTIVREAYAIAQRIPGTLDQLFCWCGCVSKGTHRSALECFESTHAAECTICIANARVAWEMGERGIVDAGQVQGELDRRYGGLFP